MSKKNFIEILKKEIKRIDDSGTAKRHEIVIEGFSDDPCPRAIIKGKEYLLFNSNDYLGLRFNPKVIKAGEDASKKYGAGPGAVRFISGTMKIHTELEKTLAEFHGKEAAMVFSSTFALNMGVIHALVKGQSKDSLVGGNTLVVSDSLNHRSIIDAIRIANLLSEQKVVFEHLNMKNLHDVMEENKEKFSRVIIVSDGVFSMLGEYQDLEHMKKSADEYDRHFEEGVITIIDDAHGVGAFGRNGRGTEEVCGAKADLLIGTLGKGFGADGGYIAGDKTIIDYLRESAATYVYSSPISPGTAAAALEAVRIVDSSEGKQLLKKLSDNIEYFKERISGIGLTFAAHSIHPIQPLLIGDTLKTKKIVDEFFKRGIIVTNISYPVVPKGKDEIRVQLSAVHTKKEIDEFVRALAEVGKEIGLIQLIKNRK